jgi:hypothetical protein
VQVSVVRVGVFWLRRLFVGSRSSSTSVAAWTWPTWVVGRRHVLEAVFVLLESLSPSRRIFIGSHSLPPSPVRRIGPSSGIRAPSDGENLNTSKTTLEGLVTLVVK